MDKRLVLVFVAIVASFAQAQYPQGDHEEEFQSAEPIAIFARSRVARGGGYGSAPVETLPVSGPTYSNQQIESLPNYGGGGDQIAPIKQDPYSGNIGGGYGSAPIKQEGFNSPPVSSYGGGHSSIPLKPVGGGVYGGGGSAPYKKEPVGYGGGGGGGGFGNAPLKPVGGGFKEDFGNQGGGYGGGGGFGNAPLKPVGGGFKEDFGNQGGGYGGGGHSVGHFSGGGYRQPTSFGYNSGSGIAFGGNGGGGGWGSPGGQQQAPPSGYGQPQQHHKQPINEGYGGSVAQHKEPIHDSYSKPPVIEPGYGTPLAPPPQKSPGGYGR